MKGWPPIRNKGNRNNRPGRPLGAGFRGPGPVQNGGLNAGEKRPGSNSKMDHGTPASEDFKFPMREKLPTKDAD